MELCYEMLHRKTTSIKDGAMVFERLEDKIEFKNIGFGYKKDEQPLFDDVSFAINKGEITAILGRSGSGKTTLINLFLRFYDLDSGVIEIDGVDLRKLDRASWRQAIGYVSQEPFVFHATVADNISFGGDYTVDEVIEAAKRADAHDFINQLPEQYDTIVGDKGMKLSGGEKQRIAIARALIRKPQILVFDEATSALDSETDRNIQETIRKISESRTVIIIAHRFSTLKIANTILAFKDGKLCETGSHADLLESGEHYAKLYELSLQ